MCDFLMGNPSTQGLKLFVKLSLWGREGVGDPMEGDGLIPFIPPTLPLESLRCHSTRKDQQFEK